MKNMSVLPSIFFAAILTACGSTGGVMKLGPDTYTLSASKHYTSGGAVAETNALEAANVFALPGGISGLLSDTQSKFPA